MMPQLLRERHRHNTEKDACTMDGLVSRIQTHLQLLQRKLVNRNEARQKVITASEMLVASIEDDLQLLSKMEVPESLERKRTVLHRKLTSDLKRLQGILEQFMLEAGAAEDVEIAEQSSSYAYPEPPKIGEETESLLEKEHARDLKGLETDMVQLAETYQTLNTMVHDQGEQVDNIQSNVADARENVQEGAKEVSKAGKYFRMASIGMGAAIGGLIGGPAGAVAGAHGLAAIAGCALGGAGVGALVTKTIHKKKKPRDGLRDDDLFTKDSK